MQLFTPKSDWLKWKLGLRAQLPCFNTSLPENMELAPELKNMIDNMKGPKETRPALNDVLDSFQKSKYNQQSR